jgi:hypothetical protein
MYMRRALVKGFPSTEFVFDKVIDNGCSKRRPDVFVDMLTHVVIVECDETQHRGSQYSCETRRTMELFVDVNKRPMVFIRFNPDSYTQNGVRVPECFREDIDKHGEKVLTPLDSWKERVQELCRVFSHVLTNIPSREITEIKLFYDSIQ